MILPDFKDFPRAGRILGVDWGARRTGIAVSDASQEFVFTRPPIVAGRGGTPIARLIADAAAAENVAGIIIGLPLRVDGTESKTTDAVRACARDVVAYTGLPVCFVDESLSSFSAAADAKLHTRAAAREKLDSEAARVILENGLAIMRRG